MRHFIATLFIALSQIPAAQISVAMTVADCKSTEFAHVIAPNRKKLPAEAAWIDGARILWPGRDSSEGVFTLEATMANDQIIVIVLEPDKSILDHDTEYRYRWMGSGARLRVSANIGRKINSNFSRFLLGARIQTEGDLIKAMLRSGATLRHHESVNGEGGKTLAQTRLQIAGALDDLYADAQRIPDLGVKASARDSKFKLWAPTAYSVALCLYSTGDRATVHPMRRDAKTGAWSIARAGDHRGKLYRYLVDVEVPSVGRVLQRVTDPYSISVTADGARSVILNLDDAATKPAGWDAMPKRRALRGNADLSIYELHVRDFSVADTTVRSAWRGKYLAFTEDQSNGAAHLRGLAKAGLTDIHLLPIFDIATIPEIGCIEKIEIPAAQISPTGEALQAAISKMADRDCYNWGYDPFHFNAPEGSYASDANDGATRVRELRAMVLALKKMGLRVGMDLVYNHTSASGQNAKSVLDRIVPGYYHRLNAAGEVERSTCCDNTATEHLMMEKLMIDSVALWTQHYAMDSFRFDLMGHQPRAAMERLQARINAVAGTSINIIGEGWNFGEVENGKRFVQAEQRALRGSGIASFNDRLRDGARGGAFNDSGDLLLTRQGWLNGGAANAARPIAERQQEADWIRAGLAGSVADFTIAAAPLSAIDYRGAPAGYTASPNEAVNYVENHDNHTLFDLNAVRLPRETSSADRARVQSLGIALTALSQGVAYFHAGIDILRSKSLDSNSFDSGDAFNAIDWSYHDNGWARGLPRKHDNGQNYALFTPILADASIKITRADVLATRDAMRDWLAIRASSPLFRIASASELQKRLTFHNVGVSAVPTLIVGHLNGNDLSEGEIREIYYFLNADDKSAQITLESTQNMPLRLHQVHLDSTNTTLRREAKFDSGTGAFFIPPRSAVVWTKTRAP